MGLQRVYVAAQRRSLSVALSFLSLPPPSLIWPISILAVILSLQESQYGWRVDCSRSLYLWERLQPSLQPPSSVACAPFVRLIWRLPSSAAPEITRAVGEVSHEGSWDVCIVQGLSWVALFPEYLHTWWVSVHLNGSSNRSALSNQTCDSASEDPAGSFLKETTTEHMTGALRQLFFPWRSERTPAYTAEQSWIPSCGHRVARLSLAEEKEQGEASEGAREGARVRKRRRNMREERSQA